MKQNTAQWNDDPGEINLVKDVSIDQKCIHGSIDAICIIGPYYGSRQIKKKGRHTICWNFCYPAEDDKKNKSGKQRLQKYPYWTQNGLLIAGDNVASYKPKQKILIMKKFTEVEIKPGPVSRYFPLPVCFFLHVGENNG
jgi:hypothetical protein